MQKSRSQDNLIKSRNFKHTQYYRYRRYSQHSFSRSELLRNELVSTQYGMIHKSISVWSSDVKAMFHELFYVKNKLQNAARIADVFNQAALIFISVGNFKYAREICYSQIQSYINWSKRVNNPHLLQFAFQPWINLIRIDRLEGNIYDAFDKLNTLHHHATMNEENIHLAIINKSLLERFKLYFLRHQYAELLCFTEKQDHKITHWNDVFIQESRIVAYANLGRVHEALAILRGNRDKLNSTVYPVLTLRECEMQIKLAKSGRYIRDIDEMHKNTLFLSEHPSMGINDIKFTLHLSYVMSLAGMTSDAMQLIQHCLTAAERLGDEILRAECLVMLYDKILSEIERKKIEDHMIDLYFKTQYLVVRKKLIHCFQDLQHVETADHHDEITPLYEDLLTFNFHTRS